ncbi:MAG TPA: coenzyme F420-0:L-glutamate ligase [Anaerolineaceae bacterium]|jgi:coenzyme F420-0:L-glutamate ligase / coenzyme F420-1:gamma-L-glutamate ligase
MTLTLTALPDIPLIRPGDDLGAILLAALAKAGLFLMDGDVLVLAQKIVSKAEGRMVNLTQVTPSPRAIELAVQVEKDARFVELVLQESLEVLRTRPGTLIVEHRKGFICANAGIDHSNVEGSWGNPDDWVLLLPVDADASAERIRRCVAKGSSLKLGVMIIDSHGRAWRNGVVGVCIGLAGLPALVDLRGEPDMLGFRLRITQVATADELAAGASLLMGQTAEGTPAIHVRGFPYPLRESYLGELIRSKETDLFR